MGAEAELKPVDSVRVVMPDKAGPALAAAALVFARQVQERCGAKVVTDGKGALTVELAIVPRGGAEGFTIADGKDGAVRIVGHDERGVLYGIGKFLRTSRYDKGGFVAGAWRGTSQPTCAVRAVYLATHFNNFYEAAPIEEVQRYVQDLGLWGYNTILVHYPTWQFAGLSDPAARKWLDRFRTVLGEARKSGLQVGLLQVPNNGYKTAPNAVRGVKVPGNFRGNFGVNLCSSKPEGRALLLQLYDELLDQFKDTGLDCFGLWPYDEGGCACEQCWPWGGRGYVSISREMVKHIRARFPACKVILSTWCFENEKDTNPDGEWVGLTKALTEDKSWVDFIMADGHDNYFPKYPLETGVPGGLPLLNFPEISMFGMNPWGGYGTNPAPAHFEMLWGRIRHKASGGAPYSEGIYEDLNKAICAQFYWDRERKAEDTVKEYVAFEFCPDAADDLLEAVRIFEKNHDRRRIGESALRAFELVRKAEAGMTAQARASWRWRVFFLRALIDKEMFERKGKLEGETLKAAFEELTRIYHAENAHSMPIKPPQVK